jgi:hypothetical protein
MRKISKQRTLSETAAALVTKPQPYKLWRMVPAEAFDEVRRLEVMGHVGLYMASIREWKDAVAGDAACAVKIALSMEIPDEIDYPVDGRMTLLLYCALNGSPGASLVLAHMLRRMPLERKLKSRLATSWLTHNLLLAYPKVAGTGRLHRRRSIAFQLLNGEESAS